jgi:hypothetical protein
MNADTDRIIVADEDGGEPADTCRNGSLACAQARHINELEQIVKELCKRVKEVEADAQKIQQRPVLQGWFATATQLTTEA